MTETTADGQPFNAKERIGWRGERRPEPGFAHTLGAGAAAFAVFAVFALIVEVTSDDATLPGVGFFLALGIASFVVGQRIAGPVRSAAITAIVFSVPLIWIFLFVGDGQGSSGSLRGIYILVVVSYAILYLFTWTAGRGILLGLALLVLFGWITAEVQGLDNAAVPFQTTFDQSSDFGGFESGSDFAFETNDKTVEVSVVSLILGLGALAFGASLDRKKLAGAATPFIVVGALYTISGAITWGADESLLAGGIAAVLSGAAVGYVGGQGTDRRASTWFGVLFIVGGFIAIVVKIVTGDDLEGGSAIGYALAFAVVAAVLAAAAAFAAPRFKEFVDGDVNAGKTG